MCVIQTIDSPGNCYLASNKKESAPKKLFRVSIITSLKTFTIDPDSWEVATQDRYGSRAAVHKDAKT